MKQDFFPGVDNLDPADHNNFGEPTNELEELLSEPAMKTMTDKDGNTWQMVDPVEAKAANSYRNFPRGEGKVERDDVR